MGKNKLYILGPAELRTEDGKLEHSFLAGPKRLALLVYLVMNQPGGFVRRDRLLPLLWPDRDQKSARNALSNMLYHIRKSLDRSVLIKRGKEELSVNPDRLWCDAIAFEQLIEEGDLKKAVEYYRGPLLDGFHLSYVPAELETWLEHERDRVQNSYLDALENLAQKEEEKANFKEAASWWKKVVSEDPLDTRVVKNLVHALAASGSYAEAVRRARAHGELLEKELGFDAKEIVDELTENLNEVRLSVSRSEPSQAEMKKIGSVAVLPFEELGDHDDISNIASGLHHDLLTRLSGVSGLKVISRTSVLHYRETDLTVPEIADKLGVETVIEGAIQQAGSQLRLHIQTIDAGSDRHEVSETYDRQITTENLFDVQSELAENITQTLRTYLTPKEKERLTGWSPTENADSYRFYSMGRRELDKRTKSSMRKALEYFQKAVDEDPGYALAWVGICDARTLLYDYGHEPETTSLPKAAEAVERALKLDPDLAEAHASMGLLHSNRHEGPDSIRELLISVELQPNYAEAHNWLSWNYQLLGDAEKALESAQTAVDLNPLSQEAVSNLAVSLNYNGFFEKSLEESRRAMDLEPDWATPVFYHALGHFELKNYRKAASLLRGLEAPWAGVGPKATYAICRYRLGDKKTAREILSEFEEEQRWFAAGLLHAMDGREKKATEYFRKVSFWDDWPTLAFYFLYPEILDRFRTSREYPEILHNVKFSRDLVSVKDWSPEKRTDEKTIAVLPFKDLGSHKETSGFSAGLHFDLISMLSRIRDLTVIASDTMQYFGKNKMELRVLSRKMGVGTVIRGGIQLTGERLRLNIQCINLQTDNIRWAETYNRELSAGNLLDIQTGLAERISENLRKNLTVAEIQTLASPHTDNLDAYLLSVKGRSYLARRTERSVNAALDHFIRALEKDPDYARAYSGFAETVSIMQEYRYPIPDGILDPFEAANKAVELEPSLGEAYTALGILHVQKKQLLKAIRNFSQAVKLQPGLADAHNWLGWSRMMAGEGESSVLPAERGKELNPMVPYTRAFLGEVYLATGRYEKALNESRAARNLQPEYPVALLMEALSLYHLNRYREAAFILKEGLQLTDENSSPPRSIFLALQTIVESRSSLNRLESPGFGELTSDRVHFNEGLIYSASGEIDEAIASFIKVKEWEPYPTALIRHMFPDMLGPVRNNKQFDKIRESIDHSWGMD